MSFCFWLSGWLSMCPQTPVPPLSVTCWGAETFWQCCGNMMRTSCSRDSSPGLFRALVFCVRLPLLPLRRGPPRSGGCMFSNGPLVVFRAWLGAWAESELCFNTHIQRQKSLSGQRIHRIDQWIGRSVMRWPDTNNILSKKDSSMKRTLVRCQIQSMWGDGWDASPVCTQTHRSPSGGREVY